jgi:NADPH2:quinone reductase
MKAVIATTQGSPDVLKIVDLPKPVPGAGQVLIKVVASSVNHIDIKVRKANLPMTPAEFPAVLQTDFAGVVEAVSPDVTQFSVGNEVYGFVGGFQGPNGDVSGALAEYIVADAALIALKPRTLDFRQAAALPLVATTAWLALHDKVKLDSKTKVLILGGTGGVGHVAVQLAKAAGAQVFAAVRSDESAALAKELGAAESINLAQTDAKEVVDKYADGVGFDVIFDTVGGSLLDAAFQMIRPAGDVITVVGAATHNLAPLYLRGANLHTVLVLIPIMFGRDREAQGLNLDAIRRLVDDGQIRPLLDPQRFSLAQVADAHRKLEAGQAAGKVVIDVSEIEA